jgi:D-alanyl-D-alanine carboxypeptidase
LVSVRRAGLSGYGSVRRVALADLKAMVRASRAAGLRLAVRSAYRSYQTQVWTFAHWVHAGGTAAALETSARPGHSEHQLGTAIDFTRAGGIAPWFVPDWGKTREGAWLARNAWRYGWVMSYPKGRKAATCYAYEPWHFRYVGKDTARQVHHSGRALRQVLWTLQTPTSTPSPTPTPNPTPTATPTSTPPTEPTPTPTDAAAP